MGFTCWRGGNIGLFIGEAGPVGCNCFLGNAKINVPIGQLTNSKKEAKKRMNNLNMKNPPLNLPTMPARGINEKRL
jgi:hypothetical protein